MIQKVTLIRPLIIMDRPGREVEYLGGFLSNLKYRLEALKTNTIVNYDRYKPRVIYTVYENSKHIPLANQYKETAKIAEILGFTWEAIYTGKKHYNKLSDNVSCFTKLITKYKEIINFYKPNIVFCYNESFILNCYDHPCTDAQTVSTALLSGSFTQYIPFITFGNLGNFTFILSEQDRVNKVKAVELNECYIRNEKHEEDILTDMRYHGSRIDRECAERLNIVQGDNNTFKFLEG